MKDIVELLAYYLRRVPKLVLFSTLFLVVLLPFVIYQLSQQTRLGSHAANSQSLLGTALNTWNMNGTASQVVSQYGFKWLTPENEMKMQFIGGCNGSYNFGPGDQIVQYAQSKGMQVHGTALVWHSQTSSCASSYSQQDLLNYVTTVVQHYCGKVTSFDVVNEALGDNGGFRNDSPWYQKFGGGGYIEASFRAARNACPGMKLYINDYGADEQNSKSDTLFNVAQDLHNKGILDGVGFQMHVDTGANIASITNNLQRFSNIGLDVAISEIDVQIRTSNPSSAQLTAQANTFGSIATICYNNPTCRRFTVWGIDDGSSWINQTFQPDAPLLFDRSFQPKPAYFSVKSALHLLDQPTPTPLPFVVSLLANGNEGTVTIPYNTAATLTWGVSNGNNCVASNGWSGSKPIGGSQSTGNLTSSRTYTLTCTGIFTGQSQSASVTVIPVSPTNTPVPPTATPIPPTRIPPTLTPTPVIIPPTPTRTPTPVVIPPTATPTTRPGVPTNTPVPPTPTPTLRPNQPTATLTPTKTPVQLTPTPTFAPTATPAPNQTILAFTLFLHGIGASGDSQTPNAGGNKTPLHAKRDLTMQIYSVTDNQKLLELPGNAIYNTATGVFQGSIVVPASISSGKYVVKVKEAQYLRRAVIATITTGQQNTLPVMTAIVGDVNNDNVLDLLDYNIMRDCLSVIEPARACTASQKLASDLNDDGKVDATDRTLFIRELTNRQGD